MDLRRSLSLLLSLTASACAIEEPAEDDRLDQNPPACDSGEITGATVRDREVHSRGNDDRDEGFFIFGISEVLRGNVTLDFDAPTVFDDLLAAGRAFRPSYEIAEGYETARLTVDLDASDPTNVILDFEAELTTCDLEAGQIAPNYRIERWSERGGTGDRARIVRRSRAPFDGNAARAGAGADGRRSEDGARMGARLPLGDLGNGRHQLEFRVCAGDTAEDCEPGVPNEEGIVVSPTGLQLIIDVDVEISKGETVSTDVELTSVPFRAILDDHMVERQTRAPDGSLVCDDRHEAQAYVNVDDWAETMGAHVNAFHVAKFTAGGCYR